MTTATKTIRDYMLLTEAEVRAALDPAVIKDQLSDSFTETMRTVEDLYNEEDFRPSEQARLDELLHEAIEPIRQQASELVVEALVKAALAFAAEYPDAPLAAVAP